MASINFEGSETKWSTYQGRDVTQVWHTGPTMTGGGTLEASRNGGTISGTVSGAWCTRHSGSFGHPVYIKVYAGSSEIASYTTPTGGNWSGISFGFSVDTNDAVTISVQYVCGQPGGCTKATYPMKNNSLWFESYNPEVPPTNVSTGVVHTTSNTSNANQSSISAKPDEEIWFDWWGQSNGYPEKNEISYYNVDINTTNNPDGASSIGITDHYIQNTHLSLFTICKSFNVKIGGTLYFWVNAYTKGGAWLGKVYLGSVKIKKDGAIFIKDGSNKREVVVAYIKDSNGNRVKLSNIQIKDGSNKRKIDVYTTLYE